MDFPLKLSKLIDLRDTNQSKLAAKTGIAQTAISDMTKGKRRPYADQAFLIARALDVSADFLMDDTLDDPPETELGVDEKIVLAIYRGLREERGMDADEAVKLLLKRQDGVKPVKPSESPRSGGGFRPIGGVDELAIEERYDKELERKRREAKKSGSGVDPDADVKGTDPPGGPTVPKRRR